MRFNDIVSLWFNAKKLCMDEVYTHKKRLEVFGHITPFFEGIHIEDINDVVLQCFATHEIEYGNRITHVPLSQNTVRREMQTIKSIFAYAIAKGYTKVNPAAEINLKKIPPKEFEIYTTREVAKLIEVARPKWLGDMILLAYHTGMRRGEVYGLQWHDIDFNRRRLSICRSIAAISPHEKFIHPPKTPSSRRSIYLDDVSVDMLWRRWLNRVSDTWVFANQKGELMSPFYNVKYFRRACMVAGIPIRRFHDLRHSHITWLLMHNVPLKIVSERAGHSSVSVTLDVYTHYIPSMQTLAVDALNSSNEFFISPTADDDVV